MDDLISRQAAIDAFLRATADGDKFEWCEYVLKGVQSVQPERKRGEWTETKEWGGRNYSCSCCKFSFMVDTCMLKPMWNFCPQCGAEMKGEEK